MPDLTPPNFEVNTAKMPSENFAILMSTTEGPSVQALEIIRHVDASFDMKKSCWDYHSGSYYIDIPWYSPKRFTLFPVK